MHLVFVAANPQLRNHTLGRDRQWAFDSASAGALVAAAAECLGDVGDVQSAFASQAHPEAAIRLLAKEQGHFDPVNGEPDVVGLSGHDYASPTGAVPEPATWAMMFAGAFGIGAVLRRRGRVVLGLSRLRA